MKKLPKNPITPSNFGDEYDSSDIVQIMDRQRRNYELMQGSVHQEDASFQDRVEISDGFKLEIDIKPTSSEKWFFLDTVQVTPGTDSVDFSIKAEDEKTDSNLFDPAIPAVVRDKIKISITNNSGSAEVFDINTDAREVPKRRSR